MDKIIINAHYGSKEFTGECIKSTLYWSNNVQKLIPLKTSGFATKQVPTDCFKEEWKIEGIDQIVELTKYIEHDKYIEYKADGEESYVALFAGTEIE